MGQFTWSNLVTIVGWVIAPLFGYLFAKYTTKYNEEKKQKESLKVEYDNDRKIMRKALMHLLREAIKDEYYRRTSMESADRGFCPLEIKEEITDVYQLYSELGGNHSAKRMFEYIIELPEERQYETSVQKN